jgi:hypothetical protein
MFRTRGDEGRGDEGTTTVFSLFFPGLSWSPFFWMVLVIPDLPGLLASWLPGLPGLLDLPWFRSLLALSGFWLFPRQALVGQGVACGGTGGPLLRILLRIRFQSLDLRLFTTDQSGPALAPCPTSSTTPRPEMPRLGQSALIGAAKWRFRYSVLVLRTVLSTSRYSRTAFPRSIPELLAAE